MIFKKFSEGDRMEFFIKFMLWLSFTLAVVTIYLIVRYFLDYT